MNPPSTFGVIATKTLESLSLDKPHAPRAWRPFRRTVAMAMLGGLLLVNGRILPPILQAAEANPPASETPGGVSRSGTVAEIARPASPSKTERFAGQSPWTNSLAMPFVPVPGTKVRFGIWDVRVRDFEVFVAQTEYDATEGMYSLRRDGWKQRGDTWKSPGFNQGPTHPVCGLNWYDAQAFCVWLTEKEQADGRIGPDQSYRLPTDAEWSVAVGLKEPSEGTPKDKSGRIDDIYPWGTEWPPVGEVGNYAGDEAHDANWPADWSTFAGFHDAYAHTSPVGSFPPNRFGLYDMGGNVWQWCEDWSDQQKKYRVLRGASWFYSDPTILLSSYRKDFPPEMRYFYGGFRCVLTGGTPP